MDILDQLQEREELYQAALIRQRKPTLPITGQCHFCREDVEVGLFCDTDCRDDYEKEQHMLRQRPVNFAY